jgi:hypothetical protein
MKYCCNLWIDWHYKNPEILKSFKYCPFCGTKIEDITEQDED